MGEDPFLEGWSRHKVCLSDPVNRPLPIYFALGRADDKPDDAVSTAPADWDMTPSDTDCALGFVWDACDMLDDVGVRFDFVVNGVPWGSLSQVRVEVLPRQFPVPLRLS